MITRYILCSFVYLMLSICKADDNITEHSSDYGMPKDGIQINLNYEMKTTKDFSPTPYSVPVLIFTINNTSSDPISFLIYEKKDMIQMFDFFATAPGAEKLLKLSKGPGADDFPGHDTIDPHNSETFEYWLTASDLKMIDSNKIVAKISVSIRGRPIDIWSNPIQIHP